MIISCPNCSKKFQVPDNAIPKAGRTVQCSSCSHEWMQYPVKEQKVVKLKIQLLLNHRLQLTKQKNSKKGFWPAPYSKEYMEQKWGSTVKNYAEQKGISKKKTGTKKIQKTKSPKLNEKEKNQVLVFLIISLHTQLVSLFW